MKPWPGNVSNTIPTPFRGSGVGVISVATGTSTTSILSWSAAVEEAKRAAWAVVFADPLVKAIREQCAAERGELHIYVPDFSHWSTPRPTINGRVTISSIAIYYCE
jgi:hypothetical protein